MLFLMIFLGVHVAVWLHANQVARAAAQEGARAARVETGSVAAGKARAVAFLDSLGDGALVDRTVTATTDGTSVRVEVHGRSLAVVPFLNLPVDAAASGPVERFRSPEERR